MTKLAGLRAPIGLTTPIVAINYYCTYYIFMTCIAIDIGGTFTDVVLETADVLFSTKVLTTSKNPERGALDGVREVLAKVSLGLSDVDTIVHGTTLATNALIERRGAKTAFVTTEGFRDVLEMRNEKRFDQYALNIELPEVLVPRPLRFTLNERTASDGSVLAAPKENDIVALADQLRQEDVEAVAVGFLHAYRNADHENLVAHRLRELLGNSVTICQSAEVAGEIREYERFSTVCANAYVRPLISRYVEKLHTNLQSQGFDGSFLMMLSDGRLTTLNVATKFPIRLVEGGPAGGVAFGAHLARQLGSDKTLSLDIGGTTAKICFIENGQPQTTRDFEVARAWRDTKGSGLPLKVPTVKLVEIGAGGGSIASVDRLGRLAVGPKSAGSDPGPAAYNRGGSDPTITDAHLTVGNISANGFAGGMIEIEPEAAPKAIINKLLGDIDVENVYTAAGGIIELADETMANAARVHGIELGHDVSRFDLLVSGGGGGLHAARIAEKLGISRIIVPQNAGVGSAVGFLNSPVAFEIALSVMEQVETLDQNELKDRIQSACNTVQSVVKQAVKESEIDISVNAELRYLGQGLDISIAVGEEQLASFALEEISQKFEARYLELTGFQLGNIPVELVSVTVTASEQRQVATSGAANEKPSYFKESARSIFDLRASERITYREIHRRHLNGGVVEGPTVIPEDQTTTLVRPGWSVQRTGDGHLILERGDNHAT